MQETEREYASSIPITPVAILENQEDGTEKIAIAFYKKFHGLLLRYVIPIVIEYL